MFEELKKNLVQEKKIVSSMKSVAMGFRSNVEHRAFYASSLKTLAEQLDLLNNAVPELLKEWNPVADVARKKVERKIKIKFVPGEAKAKKEAASDKETVAVSYVSPNTKEKKMVTINKKDRKEFLKKLKMSEEALAQIKKIETKEIGSAQRRKPNEYVSFSSRHFRKFSDKISSQFVDLGRDLKKANIPILLSSYLSMMIMSCVIAFSFGVLVFIGLLVMSLSNLIYIFLPFGFLGLTLAVFYLYPSSEAGNVRKSISYELPFATIHMAAIAGSNITPVKIFKIIAASTEYVNIGAEMKKVVMQIEIYGFDMLTSLKNVAKTSSNKKLAELLVGLATNISSGGELKNYLDKKAESFLTDYRLERQKYSALAGTFMDVYISILIAAPLILMMMFIVMNVAGLNMGGLSITALMGLVIVGLVVVNIIFMVVLNSKQPKV